MATTTIVCQSLQTCLEPQVMETLVIQQTLTPPPPKIHDTNITRGWSFLKALENPTMHAKNDVQNDHVYVHPMTKRSSSALSTKSLEMCTESLGSETGSDISDTNDEFYERVRIQKSKIRNFDRKIRRNDFPPPLTSISGSDSTVRVNHHRENGRLVIKAVSFSNCGTNFQTDRSNGRLKLSLLRDTCVNYENEGGKTENYESEGGETENYEKSDELDSSGDEVEDDVAVKNDDVEEEGGRSDGWRWDSDGNRWTIVGKVTRCKEGGNENKVFPNWRSSSWVAIS